MLRGKKHHQVSAGEFTVHLFLITHIADDRDVVEK